MSCDEAGRTQTNDVEWQKISSSTKEEETELFASLGTLLEELLEEESSANLPQSPPSITANKQPHTFNSRVANHSVVLPSLADTSSTQRLVNPFISQALAAFAEAFFPCKQNANVPSPHRTKNSLDVIGTVCLESDTAHNTTLSSSPSTATKDGSRCNPILLGLGAGAFLLPHLMVLLSLPPVLRGRGAPYLPTFGGKLNIMFDLIRIQALPSRHALTAPRSGPSLRFADLGSGDGRVVFRAARESLFAESVGYEINPALHFLASCRRWVTPRYWSSTRFCRRDLWKTDLRQYDVVAVYGLSPIMNRLGKKLEKELKPGSIVVSNVFQIPGWKVDDKNRKEGVYLYRVPECFGINDNNSV